MRRQSSGDAPPMRRQSATSIMDARLSGHADAPPTRRAGHHGGA
ncbi:hypothetical protein [Sphingobium limneticum]|nr:hypothetical protein [Sphingobium limneticum]